jgi:hypothetical protein
MKAEEVELKVGDYLYWTVRAYDGIHRSKITRFTKTLIGLENGHRVNKSTFKITGMYVFENCIAYPETEENKTEWLRKTNIDSIELLCDNIRLEDKSGISVDILQDINALLKLALTKLGLEP